MLQGTGPYEPVLVRLLLTEAIPFAIIMAATFSTNSQLVMATFSAEMRLGVWTALVVVAFVVYYLQRSEEPNCAAAFGTLGATIAVLLGPVVVTGKAE